MRIARRTRLLSRAERIVAESVFKTSLPSFNRIMVTDGLGYGDRAYVLDKVGYYEMNLGPEMFPNAVDKTKTSDSETYDEIFVHEMTHVWQYFHGYNVILSSMWANSFGDGYSCSPGRPWDSYNVEQQATLVQRWYKRGMQAGDPSYAYIAKIVRPGIGNTGFIQNPIIKLPYEKLKAL